MDDTDQYFNRLRSGPFSRMSADPNAVAYESQAITGAPQGFLDSLDNAMTDFVLYGVYNGAFAAGPPLGVGTNIVATTNELPFWGSPVQVSGNAITCQWIADSSSPSGHNLRFTIAAGAASDEAYVEQIVPIGGNRQRVSAHFIRGSMYRVGASGGAPQYTVAAQYLTAAGVATGSETSAIKTLSADATLYWYAHLTEPAPPADAASLRVRIGVKRNTMAATDTAILDLTDVRIDRGSSASVYGDWSDPTKNAGLTAQNAGVLSLGADGTYNASFDTNGLKLLGSGFLTTPEISAPGTPASGFYSIYAKTDGKLYGKNDAGTEVALGGGGHAPTILTAIFPSISGAVNDWAPTGWQTADIIEVDLGGAGRNITGISATGMTEGQTIWISPSNTGGGSLTLVAASAASSSGNRFTGLGGANYVIAAGGAVAVCYMPTVSAANPWRIRGKS